MAKKKAETNVVDAPSIRYATDSGTYDVMKLSPEAQGFYTAIVECTNEAKALRRKIAVLEAASAQFSSLITAHLNEKALITDEETSEEVDS